MAGTPIRPQARPASGVVRRPRGRPRTEIDLELVANAVAELYDVDGMEAVTVDSIAKKLHVSRATLYRAVPTKIELVGILFERSTRELTVVTDTVAQADLPAREKLARLVELQIEAAVSMRHHMPVFFGGEGLPADVFDRWRAWIRGYETMWVRCVQAAIDDHALEPSSNNVVRARLILGMCVWVSRWYQLQEGIPTAVIAKSAVGVLFPEEQ